MRTSSRSGNSTSPRRLKSTELQTGHQIRFQGQRVRHPHTFDSEADAFNLSPTTRRAAIVTHGEIFTLATDRGEIQRVTETPWLEEDPRWSPDGNWIAFVSDRTGREEIWMSDELGHKLKQLSDVDCDKSSLIWAADSKSLLWSGSDHKLRRVDVDGGKTDVLVTSDVGPIPARPSFRPTANGFPTPGRTTRPVRTFICETPPSPARKSKSKATSFVMSSGAKWTPDGKRCCCSSAASARPPCPPSQSHHHRALQRRVSTHGQKSFLTNATSTPRPRPRPPRPRPAQAAVVRDRRVAVAAELALAALQRILEVKIDTNGIERRITQLSTLYRHQ